MTIKKQEVMEGLSNGHYFAGEYLQFNDDRDVVKFAISRRGHGSEFENASEALRADKEMVLFAIDKYPDNLEYASLELKSDREVVLSAVKNNGFCLQYCRPNGLFANDREMIRVAVEESGRALRYASDELAADKEIVLKAVANDATALQFASEELCNDKEVILASFQKWAEDEIEVGDKEDIRRAFDCFKYDYSLSKEIRQLCKDKDPIEALTKAINYEKLTKKLSPSVEVAQPKRKLKI